MKQHSIAIIGGGVAGSSCALYFGKIGLDVTLFEKNSTLISGPPWCHLHAGGNLYREISDEQCIALLRQSIDFLRYYPFVVDYRPTVIVLPKSDSSTPDALLPRLDMLKNEYEKLIKEDPQNQVLGDWSDYYKTYTKEQMQELKMLTTNQTPTTNDEWMTAAAKYVDMEKIQFPVVLVQEYGLNIFRLASGAEIMLNDMQNVAVHTNTKVINIAKSDITHGWDIEYIKDETKENKTFDYLVNAAGFQTGKIDDLLNAPCKSMVEFKAAYVSKWSNGCEMMFPEIIFHGKRGTPEGMGQFTPYPNGYFQLHGMTEDITLYKDGLVSSNSVSCQANLKESFIEKIENSWSAVEIEERTKAGIKHISKFIPEFKSATVASKPLFGAQQIPGDDPTLRVAEVRFPLEYYARCEIVKVSSVLDMIDAIMRDFARLGYIDASNIGKRGLFETPNESSINTLAKEIALKRGYPESMGSRTMSRYI
ncbi:MAG: FAD-binding oxidoreductase [Epsilonproteobacteria bacterium]|nr:FAD-binding oxidoreductase [Campylobacterota bacterium]